MKEEIKKNRRLMIYTFILTIVCTVSFCVLSLLTYIGVMFKDGSSFDVKGVDGLFERRAYVSSRVSGEITTERLDQIIDIYHKYPSEEAFYRVNEQYPEIYLLLISAYSNPSDENDFLISQLTSAEDFYDQHKVKLQKVLESGRKYELSSNEINYLMQGDIKGPFIYDFTDHWVLYKNAYLFIGFLLALIGIVFTTYIFSQEKELEMDKVLGIFPNRIGVSLGKSKIGMCFTFVSINYFVSIFVAFIMLLLPFGETGWNASIQTFFDYYTSCFQWNLTQYFWITLIAGWIVLMGVIGCAALVTSILQSRMMALIVNVVIAYIPILLSKMIYSSLLLHILELHPLVNFNTDQFIKSFYSYGAGIHRVTGYGLTTAIMMATIFLTIVFCPKSFGKRLQGRIK